jgi:uncharacterized protein YuzE
MTVPVVIDPNRKVKGGPSIPVYIENIDAMLSGDTTLTTTTTVSNSKITSNVNISGNVAEYLDGTGNWSSPSGGSTSSVRQFILTVEDNLIVCNNPLRICNNTGETLFILGVYLSVNTAPTGNDIIVDVNKNGTTIFTNQSHRPRIVDGSYDGDTTTVDVSTINDGQYFQIDIDQVGSTIVGSNLSVRINARGGGDVCQAIFTMEDDLFVRSNPIRISNDTGLDMVIESVFITSNTAPTGDDIIVDINKNGVTIFTNQINRPLIVSGSDNGNTTVIDIPLWETDSYLQMDVDKVGSINPGSNLTVQVIAR